MDALVLCRGDAGDGGWSLHAPGSTDEQIADGTAPALATGAAEMQPDGFWSRPNAADYAAAQSAYAVRQYADHGMAETDEIADNMAAQLLRHELPTTMDEARAIVRQLMPDETATVIDNTAESLLRRGRFK